MSKRMWISLLLTGSLLMLAACEDSLEDNWTPPVDPTPTATPEGESDDSTAEPTPTPTPTPSTDTTTSTNAITGVEWLHTDVSGWAETATLRVSFSGNNITLNYNKSREWPAVDGVNANPWIFVRQDGVLYAATWEWFRFGQTTKPKSVVNGAHIKKSPLQNFTPVSGETYGFMVSGLARDSKRNVRERTGIVWARWP